MTNSYLFKFSIISYYYVFVQNLNLWGCFHIFFEVIDLNISILYNGIISVNFVVIFPIFAESI